MKSVAAAHKELYPKTGSLHSFLPNPIQKTGNTLLYSVIVLGLGSGQWCEPAMARMEWLCLELVNALWDRLTTYQREPAEHADLFKELMNEQCRVSDLWFDIAWTPHKMMLSGEHIVTKAAGANHRCDIHLLVQYGTNEELKSVLWLYHTTNVVEATCTDRPHIFDPVSRILVTGTPQMLQLFETVTSEYAQSVENLDKFHYDTFVREEPPPAPAMHRSPSATTIASSMDENSDMDGE